MGCTVCGGTVAELTGCTNPDCKANPDSFDRRKPKTVVPGIKARQAIITPECRAAHGDIGALLEAFERLRADYQDTLKVRGEDGAKYHVVLTVEPKS